MIPIKTKYTKIQPTNLGTFFLCKNLTIGSHNQATINPINIGEITTNNSLRKASILSSLSKYVASKITATITAI